jgi:enhancing lycopene biosynthesis protein 2
VEPLSSLSAASDTAAVVFPGGFGAAKNLSDFGFKVILSFLLFLKQGHFTL